MKSGNHIENRLLRRARVCQTPSGVRAVLRKEAHALFHLHFHLHQPTLWQPVITGTEQARITSTLPQTLSEIDPEICCQYPLFGA